MILDRFCGGVVVVECTSCKPLRVGSGPLTNCNVAALSVRPSGPPQTATTDELGFIKVLAQLTAAIPRGIVGNLRVV